MSQKFKDAPVFPTQALDSFMFKPLDLSSISKTTVRKAKKERIVCRVCGDPTCPYGHDSVKWADE